MLKSKDFYPTPGRAGGFIMLKRTKRNEDTSEGGVLVFIYLKGRRQETPPRSAQAQIFYVGNKYKLYAKYGQDISETWPVPVS